MIDSGRVKENRFDSLNNMAALVDTFVSRASAKQRRGRAGRVTSGVCYHLFTSVKVCASAHGRAMARGDLGSCDCVQERALAPFTTPEILRTPLDETILSIILLNLGDVTEFLSSAVNPPNTVSISSSLQNLRALQVRDAILLFLAAVGRCCMFVQAIDGERGDKLTPLGYHLASLPVDPRIGKMLLFGAILRWGPAGVCSSVSGRLVYCGVAPPLPAAVWTPSSPSPPACP